ncbi:MAG: sensor histidine kinase [Polyangiaceae bacterium]
MALSGPIDVLVQFGRLASEASSGADILPLLADAAIDHVKADGAAVVELTADGRTRVAASRELPPAMALWTGDADALDGELGREILKLGGTGFARAYAFPLVSTGGLFGSLVVFFVKDHAPDDRTMQLGQALTDLAAIALGRAAQIAHLAATNAELRASREALARSEKLRSLGQMAAGVSHDLKNILSPLSMQVQIAQRAVARHNDEQILQSLQEMNGVIRRGVETVERLRAFSRQAPEAPAHEVDLNALVREAMAIARPRMSSRGGALSRVVEALGDGPVAVARADEVVAAVVNLIVNAIDAMPDGGTITLSSGSSANGAWLRVADTGPGMPPEVQARIFEPFFTTKGAEGTGLGLAMVFATMQRCGGSVSVETAPGTGTAFTLSFPLANAA